MKPERRSNPPWWLRTHAGQEHLARHPLGRVPAFELDDGTTMFESAAICLQIGELYPDTGLLPPPGTSARALVYQWVLFGMTQLEGPLYRWIGHPHDRRSDSPGAVRFTRTTRARCSPPRTVTSGTPTTGATGVSGYGSVSRNESRRGEPTACPRDLAVLHRARGRATSVQASSHCGSTKESR